MRTQNDAVVKAKAIRTEDHLFRVLDYVNKGENSEQLTLIKDDDLINNINRHRKIEHKKKTIGGRKALVGKQFIISFPPEFTKEIDELDLAQKEQILKNIIKEYIKHISKKIKNDITKNAKENKIEYDEGLEIDVQDLANSLSGDLHNDTDKRHIHLIQMNTIKLKNGKVLRMDLGNRGNLANLKSSLFQEMRRLKPDVCQEFTRDELNRTRKKASKHNHKYKTSWEIVLKGLDENEVKKNIKFIKKMDRKISQFFNFINKSSNKSDSDKIKGIEAFHQDIKEELNKSVSDTVKELYLKELNDVKAGKVKM